MSKENETGFIDYQDYSDIIISRLKEFSLATFERAFNDVKDGLRPLARRALYSMYEIHLDKDFKKVQYVSGVEMKYHPYNSDTISDGITLLGQWFSKNYPFLDTQGNFGSLKNIKGYAAPRYIECKLNKFIMDCTINDIDDHCIPYVPNYDNTFVEPVYLPSKIPLTLLEGGVGIGEAYINNIPPYNLGELVDCCIKVIKNKKIPLKELMKGVYPDFPTGGEIINKSEVDEFQSLSGQEVERLSREGKTYNIKYRAKININRDNNTIEILEMPYRVDFDMIWDKILVEVNNNNNVVLSGIINHSDRKDPKNPKNIIFELICKKDANMLEIVDNLYAKTQLMTSQPLSYVLFCGKYLDRMSFKDIILKWYETQCDIIRRKFNFSLSDAQNKIHGLEGLLLVYDKVDEVIKTIKASQDKESCIKALVARFGLSMIQAKGISEMQLSSLTRASKPALLASISSLKTKIKEYESKIENIDQVIIDNLLYMKEKYDRPRRTKVIDLDQIKDSKTCINISHGALLYSRNSVGLFDSTGLLHGKSILSSLKSVKVDGKNVRELIGFHPIENNIIGTIIFNSDATARRTKLNEIPITNNWIVTNDKESIDSVVPLYENDKDNYIVCMNEDHKIKIIDANEINTKKVQIGRRVISSELINIDKIKNVLIYNDSGEYIYIDKNEIPILSRNSGGNATAFDRDTNYRIIPINRGDNVLFIAFVENEDGSCTYTAFNESILKLGHRTNKPREFFKLKHSKFVGLGIVDINTKNSSSLVVLGKTSISFINGKFIKDKMAFKKTSTEPFGLIQLPEVN